MADEDEREEAKDRHFSAMKDLQNLRDDVVGILSGIINAHYEFPPDTLAGERDERDALRRGLRDVQSRIERTHDHL